MCRFCGCLYGRKVEVRRVSSIILHFLGHIIAMHACTDGMSVERMEQVASHGILATCNV